MSERNNLPPGFKMTELGPLPEEWQVVRLGEVLAEIDIRAGEIDGTAINLPILSLTKKEGLILQEERFGKRIATEDTSNYKVVRRGAIVYNPYVIWEGAVHILSKYETGLVSPVYPVWEAIFNKGDPWFIDHLLRMPLAISAYNRFAAGAVNRRRAIRKVDFLSIKIPLPPLAEQRAIAHVLRTVQEAKEATERVIAALKEMKKSLMRHLFTYGPVPVGETERVPLRETEIGLVPAHWQVKQFEDCIMKSKAVVGKIPQGRYKPFGKYPIIDQGQRFIAGYWDEDSDVYRGELPIIIFGDHTRVLKFVNFPFVCGADGTKILKPNKTICDPLYLFFALECHEIPSRGYNRHYSLLKQKHIPLPPPAEQQEIARTLQAVDAKISAEQARREALGTLFQSLLANLMTGKVRVPLHPNGEGEAAPHPNPTEVAS